MLDGVSTTVSARAGAIGSTVTAAEAVAIANARAPLVRVELDEEVSVVMTYSELMTLAMIRAASIPVFQETALVGRFRA
ncbi:MAG: hypothetical protein ABI702_04030 [Burkholderiales bacterium]